MKFNYSKYKKTIFSNNFDFNEIALLAFEYQYNNNNIYKNFCDFFKKKPKNVKTITEIPFLPVEFFKNNIIISGNEKEEIVFLSSSTTSTTESRHYVTDLSIYEESFITTFKKFYSSPKNYCILGLLPSYLERNGSSLIYMLESLISLSKNSNSGFFLNEFDKLLSIIINLEKKSEKYILFGVSYALIDFSEKCNIELKNAIIIETGGMKGKRQEISKLQLHSLLKKNFSVQEIHSEYGMTELLSQAYSIKNQLFECPKYMKILIRDIYDPLSVKNKSKGIINIIDLANINSCCFVASSDLGEVYEDGNFRVLGRLDNSEIRGCNLLLNEF